MQTQQQHIHHPSHDPNNAVIFSCSDGAFNIIHHLRRIWHMILIVIFRKYFQTCSETPPYTPRYGPNPPKSTPHKMSPPLGPSLLYHRLHQAITRIFIHIYNLRALKLLNPELHHAHMPCMFFWNPSTSYAFIDQTCNHPIWLFSSNSDLLILYGFDSNYIHTESIPMHTWYTCCLRTKLHTHFSIPVVPVQSFNILTTRHPKPSSLLLTMRTWTLSSFFPMSIVVI